MWSLARSDVLADFLGGAPRHTFSKQLFVDVHLDSGLGSFSHFKTLRSSRSKPGRIISKASRC